MKPAWSSIRAYDPFDLPDWVGVEPVTWRADSPLVLRPHVLGSLQGPDGLHQQLDLLAADAAEPRPVCPDRLRTDVHQTWRLGEAQLLELDGRVAVAAPGDDFDANGVCEVLRRFAKSVGARHGALTVSIVL